MWLAVAKLILRYSLFMLPPILGTWWCFVIWWLRELMLGTSYRLLYYINLCHKIRGLTGQQSLRDILTQLFQIKTYQFVTSLWWHFWGSQSTLGCALDMADFPRRWLDPNCSRQMWFGDWVMVHWIAKIPWFTNHIPTHSFRSASKLEDVQQKSCHGFTAMDFANNLTGPMCKLATGSFDVWKCWPLGFCWAFWSFFVALYFVNEHSSRFGAS